MTQLPSIYTDPNSYQAGGDHYAVAEDGGIQHWDLIFIFHGCGYFIDNITKYVERFRRKNGERDLVKASQYAHKLFHLMTVHNIYSIQKSVGGYALIETKEDALKVFLSMRVRTALEIDIITKSLFANLQSDVQEVYECIDQLIQDEYPSDVEPTKGYVNQDPDISKQPCTGVIRVV